MSANIVMVYNAETGELSFSCDEEVSGEQVMHFLENLGKGGATIPFLNAIEKNNSSEFNIKVGAAMMDMAAKYKLKLKKRPFISVMEAWNNVPKGNM